MPNEQPGQITARAFNNDLITGLFWLVTIVSLINVHHIANMVLPSGWFVTAGVVATCLLLVALAPVKARQVLGRPGHFVIGAIASYAVIATVVAVLAEVNWRDRDPYLALRPWFAIAVTAGSAVGCTVVLRRIGVERVLFGVLLLLGLAAALILASPWLVDHVYVNLSDSEYDFFTKRRGRYFGTFVNPIPAGMAACCAAVLGLAMLAHVRHLGVRLLGGGIVVVATIAVALTLSRTAVITLALVLVLFLFSSAPRLELRRRVKGRVFIAVFIGLIVLAVIYRETFLVSFNVVDRFLGIAVGEQRAGVSERLALLAYGFGWIAESPLLGNGLSALGWMPRAVPCQSLHNVCGVHNSYLQYWGEAGIVPMVLLVCGFVVFLHEVRRLPRSLPRDTALGWVLVFALACLVADGIPYFLWHNFLFGLSCALLSHAAPTASGRHSVAASAGEGSAQRGGGSARIS